MELFSMPLSCEQASGTVILAELVIDVDVVGVEDVPPLQAVSSVAKAMTVTNPRCLIVCWDISAPIDSQTTLEQNQTGWPSVRWLPSKHDHGFLRNLTTPSVR